MAVKNYEIQAELRGLAPIMFDKFYDHSGENRSADQKLYLMGDNIVVMPAANIDAMLTGEKPAGAVKRMEGKKANDYLPYVKGHVSFTRPAFPFLDDDNQVIIFKEFDGVQFSIDYSGPRVIKGSLSIKQPIKPRPVLNLPWKLQIGINLVETDYSKNRVTTEKLRSWFELSGLIVALGTYRPLYGRFNVAKWEIN